MSETLNIDKQIETLDKNLEVLDWNISRAEALDRLLNGTPQKGDFNLVIVEGYLEIEAERVFNLLTHPLTVKSDDTESYVSQLGTIKNLGRYLGTKEYKGIIKISAENSKVDKEILTQQKQELLAGKGE